MNALKDLPGGLPNVHIAVVSSDMGAGDGRSRGCARRGGKNGIFQYSARGDLHGDGLDGRRDVHLGHRRHPRTTPATSRTCSPASPRWARAAAASSTSSPRSRARSAPTARRRPPRTRASCAPTPTWRSSDHQRGRLLGAGRAVAALRHAVEQQPRRRSSARRPTSAATSSAISATASRPDRHAPGDDVNATRTYDSCVSAEDGVLRDGRRHRRGHQEAQDRSGQPDPRSRRSRACATPYTVHWKQPRSDRHRPWPEISHPARPPTAATPIRRRASASWCASSGGNGLQLEICGGEFARALSRIADKIARPHPQAVHHRAESRSSRGRRSTTAPSTSSSPDDQRPRRRTPGRRLHRHQRRGPLLAARRRRERLRRSDDRRRARSPPRRRPPGRTPPFSARCAWRASRTRRGVARRRAVQNLSRSANCVCGWRPRAA